MAIIEQFEYYRRLMNYQPRCVYFGNTEWPCCALNTIRRVANPEARSLAEDAREAVVRLRAPGLWIFMPSAEPGHWSAIMRQKIETLPSEMRDAGCVQNARLQMDQTLLLYFACRPTNGGEAVHTASFAADSPRP